MVESDKRRWNDRWRERSEPGPVNQLLCDFEDRLQGGVAIDVACGFGQNAIWLAKRNFRVLGLDISSVALRRALHLAGNKGVRDFISFVRVDLDGWRPAPVTADVICVFRYLDRRLFPALQDALKPGGMLLYQTRHQGLLNMQPDANPDYLLQHNELPQAFEDLVTLYYHESDRDASFVALKPPLHVSRETMSSTPED